MCVTDVKGAGDVTDVTDVRGPAMGHDSVGAVCVTDVKGAGDVTDVTDVRGPAMDHDSVGASLMMTHGGTTRLREAQVVGGAEGRR